VDVLITSLVFVGTSYLLSMLHVIRLCFWRWYAYLRFSVKCMALQWQLEYSLTSQYSIQHDFWYIVAAVSLAPWVHQIRNENPEVLNFTVFHVTRRCTYSDTSVLVFRHFFVTFDILRNLLSNFTDSFRHFGLLPLIFRAVLHFRAGIAQSV
jgi:hypothetical protein